MGYGDLRKGRFSARNQEYLVTTVCRSRRPLFRNPDNCYKLADELRHQQQSGNLEWLAWIIMPDHFHGLLRLTDRRSLSDVMREIKGRSARAIGDRIWQPGFHDHALRFEEDRRTAAQYILANPVRSRIVESLRDYPFWYCRWMETGDDPDDFLGERGLSG